MSWSDFIVLNTELPCEPAIPLIGAYTKERMSEHRGDISMFTLLTVILFLTSKTWNQPRRPTIAEQTQ